MTPHVKKLFPAGDAVRDLAIGMGKECPSAKFAND
jgi:hypothetical protein